MNSNRQTIQTMPSTRLPGPTPVQSSNRQATLATVSTRPLKSTLERSRTDEPSGNHSCGTTNQKHVTSRPIRPSRPCATARPEIRNKAYRSEHPPNPHDTANRKTEWAETHLGHTLPIRCCGHRQDMPKLQTNFGCMKPMRCYKPGNLRRIECRWGPLMPPMPACCRKSEDMRRIECP